MRNTSLVFIVDATCVAHMIVFFGRPFVALKQHKNLPGVQIRALSCQPNSQSGLSSPLSFPFRTRRLQTRVLSVVLKRAHVDLLSGELLLAPFLVHITLWQTSVRMDSMDRQTNDNVCFPG